MTAFTSLLPSSGNTLTMYVGAGMAIAAFLRLVVIPRFTGAKAWRTAGKAETAQVFASATPLAGQALLYVARSGVISMIVNYEVELDGRVLAGLKGQQYLRIEAAPGTHQLTVGPKGFTARMNPPVSVTFDLRAGDTAVYVMSTEGGTMTQNRTALVRQEDVPAALGHIAAMKPIPVRKTA